MSKFWDKMSLSFMAAMVLIIAYGVALSGCDRQPTPNASDEVFCIYSEEPDTGGYTRFCCREFAADPSVDCWRE